MSSKGKKTRVTRKKTRREGGLTIHGQEVNARSLGLSSGPGEHCSYGLNCPKGYICTNSACVKRTDCGHFWQRCPDGESCQNGKCLPVRHGGANSYGYPPVPIYLKRLPVPVPVPVPVRPAHLLYTRKVPFPFQWHLKR